MTTSINRRALLGVSGASLAAAALPMGARADETPAAAPPPRPSIEVFARTPQVANIALSPDGKRVAVVTRRGDTGYLLFFDVANPQLKSINMGPPKVRTIFWGDNEHVVLVNSMTTVVPEFVGYKNEFLIARSVDLNTTKVRVLFGEEENFYGMVLGDLQRVKVNGEYRVTASNYQMQNEYPMCLYSFGMTATHGHMILMADHDTRDFVVTPDGQVLAYANFNELHKIWELYFNTAIDQNKQSFKSIYKLKGEVLDRPEVIGLGRDGKSVVLFVDGNYHEIGADGVLGPPLDTDGVAKHHGALFHPTTGRLAGFSRQDDWESKDYFDPLLKKLDEALPKVMGDDARFEIASFAEDPRKMIVYTEDKGDAGSYWFSDLSTGDLLPVTNNYPELPIEWVTQKQAIDYKAADGLNIHAYLTLPPFKEPKNLPLIVLPHGGPEARDDISFDWQVQALASLGYAVLQPNFRGSSGYGDAFVEAGYGEWGRKMQTDLSDGVRYLAGKGTVDMKRVAIFGSSYGGYAAMAGATLDTGVYTCAVAVAGISDIKSFIDFQIQNSETSNSTRVLYWKQFLGDQKHWDDVSPAKQATKSSCPVLLIHGTDDTVVPIDQSQRMERALKAAGREVQLLTYKGQDHWEDIPSARVSMMQATVDFLLKHNPA